VHAVIETPSHLSSADYEGVTEDERAAIVAFIAERPTRGDLIRETGGARKVRFPAKRKGKNPMTTTTTRKAKRGRPARTDFGTRLLQAAHEAIAIARGEADPATYRIHVPSDLDVRAIRHRANLSQQAFADRFGFTLARIRDWEQGRSKPDGAIRAYLMVIDREREAVERALSAA
jgi:putative transcriptional regulator